MVVPCMAWLGSRMAVVDALLAVEGLAEAATSNS
jgi:hypothetical protein